MSASKSVFLFVLLITLPQLSQAGWQDFTDSIKQKINERIEKNSKSALSEEAIADALKQALYQGIKESVKQLKTKNGFLADASVRIPMPQGLTKVEKALRKIGQKKVADDFVATMNEAAEQSVAKTVTILVDAVKNMTLTDAVKILNGEQNAATMYFRTNSESKLRDLIKPIVTQTTQSVGLTRHYKKLTKASSSLQKYMDKDSLDLDEYITRKAIDGLFVKIADEENRIRNNPLSRRTNLLKDVFGSLDK
ncbi:MAG: DUF4197 domain-containing protein [Gammaproteobacteria bacterium]|nr:DUF4197 domain-containing protein [Gammaproteobacteria bacterium]